MTVCSLCAIVNTVHFANFVLMVFCISLSVWALTLAVASSITKILLFLKMIKWHVPSISSVVDRRLRFVHLLPLICLSKLQTKWIYCVLYSQFTVGTNFVYLPMPFVMASLSSTSFKADNISSSSYSWKGSRLYLKVPLKRIGSYKFA